ncbi:EscU/YscU/HrcU family type III secretion system export apparatus switch protein [Anaeromicrobium sediminis]|uniref:Flagellar biosynthesis protein FlhB n=1 Tax=Anaeromicrobium sediminis TaxID=1478221 RepID=A0A267MP31_9FIRM|nr:EscU/YscU/HrcU family type III secretion system export apparatus switch protein [Anaeromicrobium sediminis]PAB61359.1 flagellar biosynthesis protein FlhB [Anaeromicrobium sediminis]
MDKKVAVAIKYDHEKDSAPKVIGKGQGHLAEKIEALAKELSIPIHENEALAYKLNDLDLGEEIPVELYNVVAQILSFIIEIDMNEGK